MQKTHFEINGMTCSACSARIEKTLAKIDAIDTVSVNLLTNSMLVNYDEARINTDQIIKAVEEIGYGAKSKHKSVDQKEGQTPLTTISEAQEMKKRLLISVVFTIPLLYLSMGEMLNWPLPSFITGINNAMVYAFSLFLLVIPVVVVNRRYFIVGFKNLLTLAPNMDSLIALGSSAAVIYGIFAIYRIAWGFGHNNIELVHHFAMNLYFESAATILTLITLGKFFETRAKGQTSEAITKLMDLAPKTAILQRDGIEIEVAIDEVKVGDALIVKAGSSIPVDGVITNGYASLDESAITGESLPVEKKEGDRVTGGTILKAGYIVMEATAIGENTALARIIALVDEATSSKAPIAKIADRISAFFVPAVIVIALAAAVFWISHGNGIEFALTAGIAVLVISCPCALGLATPTAIMVGTGLGASHGILFKSAEALETLKLADTIVLDKTGTVTLGKPMVTDIMPHEIAETEFLRYAASLEKNSSHPLSIPIVNYARGLGLELEELSNYEIIPGQGIIGIIKGQTVIGGNRSLMTDKGVDIAIDEGEEKHLAMQGKTILYFAYSEKYIGFITLADTLNQTSLSAVAHLKKMGKSIVMLTGDNSYTAEAIAKQVGIETVIANVRPEEKEKEILSLQETGRNVVMVGDGINDAPALARANIGIAIGTGTEIAIESADVVLMKSDLRDVVASMHISSMVVRNIKQNLFWAFVYNIIGIPIAAGLLYPQFGLLLSPMIAAAAMSFSSLSVVSNALRLKLYNPKNVIIDYINQEESVMIKTLKIEGMSCMHCVGAVTKALNAIDGVSNVKVDLESKTASVEIDAGVEDKTLQVAVEEAGFQIK